MFFFCHGYVYFHICTFIVILSSKTASAILFRILFIMCTAYITAHIRIDNIINKVNIKDVGSVAAGASGAVSIPTEVEVGGSNCDGAVECDISNCSAGDSDSRLMNGASGKFTTRKNSRHFCKLKL